MTISQQAFECACIELEACWPQSDSDGGWQEVKVLESVGRKWLHITARLRHGGHDEAEAPIVAEEGALEEDDDEALSQSSRPPKQPLVVYDIVHSASYQTPVLYITFKDLMLRKRGLPPPAQLYNMLVPPAFRPQMDGIGPMGALSMTDHPITSTPAYFVHPCRTVDAMHAVTGGKEVEGLEYLLQWTGVIGQSVGLSVPSELAQASIAARSR